MEYQAEVLERLARIETKMNGICDKQADHEKRIRFLERGMWLAVGVLVVADIILNFMMRA